MPTEIRSQNAAAESDDQAKLTPLAPLPVRCFAGADFTLCFEHVWSTAAERVTSPPRKRPLVTANAIEVGRPAVRCTAEPSQPNQLFAHLRSRDAKNLAEGTA